MRIEEGGLRRTIEEEDEDEDWGLRMRMRMRIEDDDWGWGLKPMFESFLEIHFEIYFWSIGIFRICQQPLYVIFQSFVKQNWNWFLRFIFPNSASNKSSASFFECIVKTFQIFILDIDLSDSFLNLDLKIVFQNYIENTFISSSKLAWKY